MPTIEENRSLFDGTYTWPQAGEEWSEPWGSVPMQWHGSILPRINPFVPADTILEVGPGYGRWTAFLKDLCKRLIVVDLAESCINRCRERFANCSQIVYFVNDGESLEMVTDSSVDFIFSFDSLVHAEASVLKAYSAEFAKKLRPDGVAFIHHSNLGEYTRRIKFQAHLSRVPKLYRWLERLSFCDNLATQWRACSMTAAKMALFAQECGLECVGQELITWETRFVLVDCLSTLVPHGSKWSRPNRILRNPGFMLEAKQLADLSRLYAWPSVAKSPGHHNPQEANPLQASSSHGGAAI